MDAGKKSKAPTPVTLSPRTMPLLYPIREMMAPAGIDVIK